MQTIKSAQNTTGDWLNIQQTSPGRYRVIGQRINYVRGRNVVRWVVVKDNLSIEEATSLFDRKLKGKRV